MDIGYCLPAASGVTDRTGHAPPACPASFFLGPAQWSVQHCHNLDVLMCIQRRLVNKCSESEVRLLSLSDCKPSVQISARETFGQFDAYAGNIPFII